MFKNTCLLLLFILFGYSDQTEAEQVIRISQTNIAARNDCAERSLREAYKMLDIQLKFEVHPNNRALIESNRGYTDGEAARTKGLDKFYPNLVIIPVPICRVTLHLVHKKNLNINTLISTKKYTIGIVRGHVIAEKLVDNFQNIITTTNITQLVNMVERQRINTALIGNPKLEYFEKLISLGDFKVLDLKENTQFLYHYLNKKHTALIPRITQALKQLEANGFTEKSMREHESYAQEQARLKAETN